MSYCTLLELFVYLCWLKSHLIIRYVINVWTDRDSRKPIVTALFCYCAMSILVFFLYIYLIMLITVYIGFTSWTNNKYLSQKLICIEKQPNLSDYFAFLFYNYSKFFKQTHLDDELIKLILHKCILRHWSHSLTVNTIPCS